MISNFFLKGFFCFVADFILFAVPLFLSLLPMGGKVDGME